MASLACYLDESADEKREEVFAVAGFLGYTPSWFELERQWQARLTKDGLQYFRAVDCENVRGPFTSFRANEQKLRLEERIRAEQVRTDLIEIVKRIGMVGIGVGMLMRDFNEVIRDETPRKIFSTDPYHLTYRLAFTQVADVIRSDFPKSVVAFTCDEHEQRSAQAQATYQTFKERNPDLQDYMGSLTYFDDKKCAQLQSADLMAFEAMHKARRWLKQASGDRQQFTRIKGIVHKIEVCNKNALIRLVESNKQYL